MAQLNIKDAENTYSGFISLVKWGAGITAIVVALVVIIIQ
jgi:hypothetical protein